MGYVKPRAQAARLFLTLVSVALAGCYVPLQTSGVERAIALYRESRAPSGALSMRHRRAMRAPEAAPSALTVEQAVALAKENSAEIAALEARAQTAKVTIEATAQYANPQLSVSNLHLNQFVDGEPRVRPSIRFSPSRPGEVDAKVAVARAAEATARADVLAAELTLEADVRWLFDNVLLLDAEIAAAEAVAAARRSLAARMRERLEASEATAIDDAMAELGAVEAEQDSADYRAQQREALGELLDRVGLDPGASVRILGDPMAAWPPPALPPEEILVEAALKRRAEIRIAAARIDAADAQLYIERGKRWPWLSSVQVGYAFQPNMPAGLGWTFQFGIDLPIFNTNRAAVVAAEEARTAEQHALGAEVEQVAREVRRCLREAQATEALVTELQRRALPVAERADAATKKALEGRGIDVIRALTVDEHRVLVQIRRLRLMRRYRTALADLRRAVGGRLPTEVSGDSSGREGVDGGAAP